MLRIFVVSDATGQTAERMVRSALVQFKEAPAIVIRRGNVCTPEQLRAIVQEAVGHDSLILHTLVCDELRRLMLADSRAQGVDAMDLMGPMLDRLAKHLKLRPQEKPGLFKQLVEARSREIEAVGVAFGHAARQHHATGAGSPPTCPLSQESRCPRRCSPSLPNGSFVLSWSPGGYRHCGGCALSTSGFLRRHTPHWRTSGRSFTTLSDCAPSMTGGRSEGQASPSRR